MSCIEFISENVLLGLSGTMEMGLGAWRYGPPKNPVSEGTSEIFYYDVRESTKQINYHSIRQYRGDQVYEEFQTLSCNKTNRHEFVIGSFYDAKIFDIRQMKKPCFNFGADCSTRRLRSRNLQIRKLKPRRFNVSWSPTGKYIFTHAQPHDLYYGQDYFDRRCNRIDEKPISFFWDVENSSRVEMIVDSELMSDWVCHQWNRGVQTWINDTILIGNMSKIVAINPHAKTVEELKDFLPEHDVDDDEQEYDAFPFKGAAYNDKTLQLAGSNGQQIFIWSHYKLPPYPTERIIPRSDDSDY